ncbi:MULTISPECIES: NADPH-dependent FMN reductase [Ralstonia solanacearum species complex]|uniref:Nadph-dependent fmn reductase protein n=2 Tax=Ralstonia solanacearum TaxID=305 RepID=A0ABF7RCM4_RALSL|nr:NADPH-dependent FMN reductase [Ralstonia solanacearum]ALF88115.1 FMN reductase (NADPH) [Ralstonia solanacearum]ATI27590.1 FMN reductase (NADPH) [Ralstonia solanacearum]KEI33813.1 FMN reductase [Ralstonia solanacearum]KFX80831.1 FMN reductase [Ralstonia solanacearum]KFX85488.1 FMN reductase [Ralstonia solanacearum]
MPILTISGSPSAQSRSARLLGHVRAQLERAGESADHLDLRALPADALLGAQTTHPAIAEALARVEAAGVVILATPVYKAAYSGLLKTFLDLLPQSGLRDKVVLPIATGGSLAHTLAIDYALRPVLSSLAARAILPGIFAVDAQMVASDAGLVVDPALQQRLDDGIERVHQALALARHPAVAQVIVASRSAVRAAFQVHVSANANTQAAADAQRMRCPT